MSGLKLMRVVAMTAGVVLTVGCGNVEVPETDVPELASQQFPLTYNTMHACTQASDCGPSMCNSGISNANKCLNGYCQTSCYTPYHPFCTDVGSNGAYWSCTGPGGALCTSWEDCNKDRDYGRYCGAYGTCLYSAWNYTQLI